MAFSATDASLEGFKVVRRDPMSLVWWSLFYAAVMVVAGLVVGGSMLQLITAGEQLEQLGDTATFADFGPFMQLFGMMMTILLPVSLISSAMIYAAVSRAVLRPAEKAFGYLRLGADELRVLAVSLVLALAFMVVIAVSWGVIFGVAAAAVASPMLWFLVALVFIGSSLLFIWLAVRFSLAIPITMAERRIAIMDSFKMTRGRFWPLLGMAFIAMVLTVLVSVLGSVVMAPFQLLAGGGIETLAGSEGLNPLQILTQFWPVILAYVVVNAIVSALQVAVLYAPFSAAYRDIVGRDRATVETFA